MILFNIILNEERQIAEISDFLLDHSLALSVHIDTNKVIGYGTEKNTVRIFFITRALLYDHIATELARRFVSPEMFFYATPVTHVSDALAKKIRETLKKPE